MKFFLICCCYLLLPLGGAYFFPDQRMVFWVIGTVALGVWIFWSNYLEDRTFTLVFLVLLVIGGLAGWFTGKDLGGIFCGIVLVGILVMGILFFCYAESLVHEDDWE